MRAVQILALTALLAGCAPVQTSPSLPAATGTSAPPEATHISDTATATDAPTPTPTLTPVPVTPTPACDPSQTFCIQDGHFFFQRPISSRYRVTADQYYLFGTTQFGSRLPHHGVDLPNASGTPVLAAADGTVVFAGSDAQTAVSPWTSFYGNVVIIQHQFAGVQPPVYSLYGHLSKVLTVQGQSVHAGDLIGLVGSTGVAIGSHLHFEVRVGGNSYDGSSNPALWLVPLAGTGVIAGRIIDGQGDTLHLTNIKIQFYPGATGNYSGPARQIESYAAEKDPVISDAALQENFAAGDLAAGRYRLTFITAGHLYERWVEVQSGKLTDVEFLVK